MLPPRAIRVTDGPVDPRVERVQLRGALPELPLVPDLRTVVREKHHHRIVLQPDPVQGLQEMPDPAVHEGHVSHIERPGAFDLRLQGIPAVDHLRIDVVLHRRIGKIHIRVMARRVPQLVRAEAVDPEEERGIRRIVLHPLRGSPEHLCGQVVLLPLLPVQHVQQVLRDRRVLRRVRLTLRRVRRQGNAGQRSQPVSVVLLPPDELPGHEPPGEIHRRFEHVVHVRHQSRGIPPIVQPLR